MAVNRFVVVFENATDVNLHCSVSSGTVPMNVVVPPGGVASGLVPEPRTKWNMYMSPPSGDTDWLRTERFSGDTEISLGFLHLPLDD